MPAGHQHLSSKRYWHELPVAGVLLILVCMLQAFIAEPSHSHAHVSEAVVIADRAAGCFARHLQTLIL